MKKEEKPVLPEVSWIAPEFRYVEKTKDWYWVLWIVCLAIAAASFMLGNYTFAVLIGLSAFVFSLLASKRPQELTMTLDDTHVVIQEKKYRVDSFEAYNFLVEDERLLLKSKKQFVPLVSVPLGDRPPEGKLRTYLEMVEWQEDDELSEPFIELFMERLGF